MLDPSLVATSPPEEGWPATRHRDATVDGIGITWRRPSRVVWRWSDLDRLAVMDDEGTPRLVAAHRDGTCRSIPGLDGTGGRRESDLALMASELNRIVALRRRSTPLSFPIVLTEDTPTRLRFALGAGLGFALAALCLLVALSPANQDNPWLWAPVMIAAAVCAYGAVRLLWEGCATATFTPDRLERRLLLYARRTPLSEVATVHSWPGLTHRRCAAYLHNGRVVRLPGCDPEYALPALDAHLRSQRRRRRPV